MFITHFSSFWIECSALIVDFDKYICRKGLSRPDKYRTVARHFLIWLRINRIALASVDCVVIEQFLQHECSCRTVAPSTVQFSFWHKCRSNSHLMRFIQYLECSGRVKTPEELKENLQILSDYLEQLDALGYSAKSIKNYHSGCTCLIVWLHLSRISLRDLTTTLLEPFWNRRINCSYPEVFHGQCIRSTNRPYQSVVRKFLIYLVEIGRIAALEPSVERPAVPAILMRFDRWLEHNRNLIAATRRNHVRQIERVLPVLGENPELYDADLLSEKFLNEFKHCSKSQMKALSTSMRLYLGFLAMEDYVSPALSAVVPKVPQWRFSSLPRYISDDDVTRTIASCDDTPAGIRNRAILLLLARLALRAGDIIALCLDDIDWVRAEIQVLGKSLYQTVLPLPQDVGDAIYRYITMARPRISEERVFLTTRAPYRSLSSSSTVSTIANTAFNRADIVIYGGRGAHVFRHSKATSMLRSGASLDAVQALLRHESRNTTMIYAKTDVVMLQEVAQPWIGGIEQ